MMAVPRPPSCRRSAGPRKNRFANMRYFLLSANARPFILTSAMLPSNRSSLARSILLFAIGMFGWKSRGLFLFYLGPFPKADWRFERSLIDRAFRSSPSIHFTWFRQQAFRREFDLRRRSETESVARHSAVPRGSLVSKGSRRGERARVRFGAPHWSEDGRMSDFSGTSSHPPLLILSPPPLPARSFFFFLSFSAGRQVPR